MIAKVQRTAPKFGLSPSQNRMNDQPTPFARRWRSAGLTLAALLIPAALAWSGWLQAAWRTLNADSIAGVAAYVRGFGLWAPAISLLLMLLQSVIAPLPGSIVAAANGVIFGVWWGTLLSWAANSAGTCSRTALTSTKISFL